MGDMILPFTLPFTLGGGPEGVGASSTPPVSPGATVDVTVRLQALDGTWETCGADRAIKVDPESLQASANEWGSDKASFNLHRSVIAIWPDIGAFSPVEIEVGGVIVWEGRTGETPIRSGAEQVINVQCAGWQYHLDDDVYQRTYVHAKLTDWKDCRSFLNENLALFTTAGQVGSQQGAITLGWPNGSVLPINAECGVKLDLGQQNTAAAIGIEVKGITGAANSGAFLLVKGHPSETFEGTNEPFAPVALSTIGTNSNVYEGSFPTASRYVTISLFIPAGVTLNGDVTLQIRAATVVTVVSYITAGATTSTLKAWTVVKDAIERATLLLSSDLSQIQTSTFTIPDFSLGKASTPREAIEAANAYHNWIAKLKSGRRVAFGSRPVDASLEVGAWSGADIEDASANNGAEIYNRAIIEATAADGSALVVERSAIQQPGVMPTTVTSPTPENPSFAVNTAGWSITSSGATFERDTVVFSSAPASGKLSKPNWGGQLTAAFTGTFTKGVQYRLLFVVRGQFTGTIQSGSAGVATLGTATDWGVAYFTPGEGVWRMVTVAWQPQADATGVTLKLIGITPAGAFLWVDDLSLQALKPTLIDRRNFRRTKVIQMSSAITPVEGEQLGDTFLKAHMTTPFKGSASVLPGGVRTVVGGQPTHPSTMLLRTQELLRLSHLTDPDTGGVSRDGTIAEVVYTHKDQKAAVTLDDKRQNFDALLARLAVVQSVGS